MKIKFIFLLLLTYFNSYAQTETSGRTFYRATNEKKTKLKHTKLKISLNFENQTLAGEEWLTATPFFYASDSLILNAKSMLIHEIKIKNKDLKYLYKNDILKIKLDKTYQKGETYTIYIKYTSQPEKIENTTGGYAIKDNKGLFFINPKGDTPNIPTQVWTQGETEASSTWFPTIDSPNQKTTQEIYITVPDKYITLSNGILKSSEKLNHNLREDYWLMDKPHAPYLFFFGVGEFSKIEDTPWRNKVPITYYVEKEYKDVAKQIFGNTREMIEFFSNKFGYDFPWQKYAQIVVRDFVAGAMENTTAVAHAESAQQDKNTLADQNNWEAVIAHELAHHWFGDLVTAESWSNLTLNESFANYSEYLWFDHKYNKDKAEQHRIKSINKYYNSFDDYQKELVRFTYKHKDDMFDRVSYNKGGAILHMLRDYLGDEAFFKGIANYLKTNQFGTGEVPQLRIEFEKISGKDLNWFFAQWYYGKGHPKIQVTKNYDSKNKILSLKIIQKQDDNNLFQFPIEIDIYQNSNKKRYSVWVNAKKENTFDFKVDQAPKLIDVNPRGVILTEEEEYKTTDEYLYQYENAIDYKSRYQAVKYAQKFQTKNILIKALRDSSMDLRIAGLNALSYFDLCEKELETIESIAKNDPENLVKAAAIWILSRTKKTKYTSIFEKGLYAESSAIKNSAINGISVLSPEIAKPFLEKTNARDFTSDQLMNLLPVIVKYKMDKYLAELIPYIIYYPSFKVYGEETKAKYSKEAFLWAMNRDDKQLTNIVVETLQKTLPYTNKNSKFNNQILEVLDLAINTKKKLKPTKSIQKQIENLVALKKKLKNK